MALLPDKFSTIKTLIQQHLPSQAKDECGNGINNECVNAKSELENIKGKLIDKFGTDELFDDFEAILSNYF